MSESLTILATTALVLGLTHTLIGPDHYLPFIVLGRAEKWSLKRTLLWTFLCGLGHVGSSVLIGSLGILLGWSLAGMEGFESIRGTVASVSLMGFGGVYMLWGLYRAIKGRAHQHAHPHLHADGSVHDHLHRHSSDHHHTHADEGDTASAHRRTFWAVFIVFVLGPCEPLIPLLMVPASEHSVWGMALVTAVFAIATISVMMITVVLGYLGVGLIRLAPIERYVHAFSGGAILTSGLLIQLFGI